MQNWKTQKICDEHRITRFASSACCLISPPLIPISRPDSTRFHRKEFLFNSYNFFVEIGIIAMKQGIDSVEKLQKKRFFSRKTRVSETLKKCNSYRISSYSIHNNWIILYIFSLDVDQNRHSRANITTMHNLFSITSTLRIELNWIELEHFFATCFYIITCNFAN